MGSAERVQPNWLANVGWLSAARVFGYLLPLITLPIVVRVLGPEVYGKWVYAQAVVGFFGVAANPGLRTYGLQQVAARRKLAAGLLPPILSLLLTAALVSYIGLVGPIAVLTRDPTSRALVVLLGLNLVLSSVCANDWVFSGLQRFDRVALLQVFSQLITTGGVVLLLRRSETVWLLPVLALVATAAGGLVGWRWLGRAGIRLSLRWSPGDWRDVLRVASFYGMASAMSMVYQKADHLMVGWLKGSAALGQYGGAYRLMEALMGFIAMGTSVVIPYAAATAARDPGEFRQLIRKSLLVLAVVSVPLAAGGAFLADDLVALVLGPSYSASAPAFRVLMLAVPLGGLSSLFAGAVLYAPGHHRRYALAVGIGAVVNMVLNVVLIPPLGGIGAAIATAVAQGSVALAAVAMGRGYLVGAFSRSLLSPFLASGGMAIALLVLQPYQIHVGFKVIAGALVYLAAVWMLDLLNGRDLRAAIRVGS